MRTIQDDSFRTWEAYATTGQYGFSDPARIIFRCVTDPNERARFVTIDGDKSDAEARVRSLSNGELQDLMEGADVVD
ncbi:MAG: hypothetical protein R3223_05315 [Longimicrobiales bacterium]|nr:hypothetical protein [Longimicrobiales bacterium]